MCGLITFVGTVCCLLLFISRYFLIAALTLAEKNLVFVISCHFISWLITNSKGIAVLGGGCCNLGGGRTRTFEIHQRLLYWPLPRTSWFTYNEENKIKYFINLLGPTHLPTSKSNFIITVICIGTLSTVGKKTNIFHYNFIKITF